MRNLLGPGLWAIGISDISIFKIVKIHEKLPKNELKNLKLGFDPNLFTYKQLNYLFGKKIKLLPIKSNLIDHIFKTKEILGKPFYSLPTNATGESHKKKVNLNSAVNIYFTSS